MRLSKDVFPKSNSAVVIDFFESWSGKIFRKSSFMIGLIRLDLKELKTTSDHNCFMIVFVFRSHSSGMYLDTK